MPSDPKIIAFNVVSIACVYTATMLLMKRRERPWGWALLLGFFSVTALALWITSRPTTEPAPPAHAEQSK